MLWKGPLLSARLQPGLSLSSVATRFCATLNEIVAAHLGMLTTVEDVLSVTADLNVVGVVMVVNVNVVNVETAIATMQIAETEEIEWIEVNDVETETETGINPVISREIMAATENTFAINPAISPVIMAATESESEIGIGIEIGTVIAIAAKEEIELTGEIELSEEIGLSEESEVAMVIKHPLVTGIIVNVQWIEKEMGYITPKIAVWNLPVITQGEGEMLKSIINQINPRILIRRIWGATMKRSQSGLTVSTPG